MFRPLHNIRIPFKASLPINEVTTEKIMENLLIKVHANNPLVKKLLLIVAIALYSAHSIAF